jgi:hypothetical protein
MVASPSIASPIENDTDAPLWFDHESSGTGVLNVRCASFLPFLALNTRPTYSEFPPGTPFMRHLSAM